MLTCSTAGGSRLQNMPPPADCCCLLTLQQLLLASGGGLLTSIAAAAPLDAAATAAPCSGRLLDMRRAPCARSRGHMCAIIAPSPSLQSWSRLPSTMFAAAAGPRAHPSAPRFHILHHSRLPPGGERPQSHTSTLPRMAQRAALAGLPGPPEFPSPRGPFTRILRAFTSTETPSGIARSRVVRSAFIVRGL